MDIEPIKHGADRVEVLDTHTGLYMVYRIESVFADPLTGRINGVEYQLPEDDMTAFEFDTTAFRFLW